MFIQGMNLNCFCLPTMHFGFCGLWRAQTCYSASVVRREPGHLGCTQIQQIPWQIKPTSTRSGQKSNVPSKAKLRILGTLISGCPGLFCWLAGALENMGADAGMLGHIWLTLLPGESFAPRAACPLTLAGPISLLPLLSCAKAGETQSHEYADEKCTLGGFNHSRAPVKVFLLCHPAKFCTVSRVSLPMVPLQYSPELS